MLRHHYRCYGTTPDGCLFRGARGGPLSESSYGRTWHTARTLALGPAAAATTLARRPYDLRHAALSLWLNAGTAPAQIAQRAGHSITMLLAVYTHCIDGQGDITNRQIERALYPPKPGTSPDSKRLCEPPVPPRSCPPYVRAWPTLTRPGGSLPASAYPHPRLPAALAVNRFRSSERIRWSAAGFASSALD